MFSLLLKQLWVLQHFIRIIILTRCRGQTEVFISPGTEIVVLAAFATKWAVSVGWAVQAGPTARWAGDGTGGEGRMGYVIFKHRKFQNSDLAAQRQIKRHIITAHVQPVICAAAHHAHRHHESVTADFRNQAPCGINAQA